MIVLAAEEVMQKTEEWSPPRDPGPFPPTRRPSRRRWIAWGALFGAVAILATAMGLFLTNYDPLCHQDCTGFGGASGPTVRRLGDFTAPSGESFTAYRAQHVPGKELRIVFTLSNEGPFGITITHVGFGPGYLHWLSMERVQTRPESGNQSLSPFRPFSLSAREYVDVFVTLRMTGCLGQSTQTQIGSIPVTFRVLGFTRHTTVSLPESIVVAGRRDVQCPH
jgi:hypothetical protein